MTETKSAPKPAFKPAVGDEVSGIGCAFPPTDETSRAYGVLVKSEGDSTKIRLTRPTPMKMLGAGELYNVHTSSLKPAPAEFYGTMPRELPAEIPSGTPIAWNGKLVATGTIRLVNGYYVGPSADKSTGFVSASDAHYQPDTLDWSRIPKPSQKAVPAQAAWAPQPGEIVEVTEDWDADEGIVRGYVGKIVYAMKIADGDGWDVLFEGKRNAWNMMIRPYTGTLTPKEPGQSPPDPYAGYDLNAWGISSGSERERRLERVREILTCTHEQALYEDTCRLCGATGQERVVMTKRREAAGAFGKPLDSRIASARQATEREAGVKHPESWPEGAGEELYVS